MKKFLVASIAAVALLCTAIIGGCGNDNKENCVNYSETYQGAVSTETYETRDEAVKGFIATEINGKTTEAVLVGYEKEKELSAEEINSLAIGEEYKTGLISVEKGQVTYSENSQTPVKKAISTKESDTGTKDIYILEYTDEYRFFTPELENGETLTASYFNSTFDSSKYVNCTMEMNMKLDIAYKIDEYNMKSTSEAKSIMKVIPEALYVKTESKTSVLGQSSAVSDAGYYIDTTDGIYEITKNGNNWKAKKVTDDGTEIIEKTMTEYFMEFFKTMFGEFDHTYFEKAATGYTLRADKLEEFIENQPEDSLIGTLMGVGYKFDEPYLINIADGRLSDVSMKISYNMNNEYINGNIVYEMNFKFYDFGVTVVSVPDEGINALPDGVTAGKRNG